MKPVRYVAGLCSAGSCLGHHVGSYGTLGESVPPLRGAAARFLLAAVLLIPLILWKRLKLPPGRTVGYILLLSASMIAMPFMLLLWAGVYVSSATVAVLFAAMPLLVVLLTPSLEGRPWRTRVAGGGGWIGSDCPGGGCFISGGSGRGGAVALVGVALIGASSLIARRELRSVHPIIVTALLLGAAGCSFFLPVWPSNGAAGGMEPQCAWFVIFLAAVAGAPAYAVYFWLLQQLEAYQMATVQWIEPW